MSESFKSVAQGVPEIFEEVYLGGGGGGHNVPLPPPPPLVGIGLKDVNPGIHFWCVALKGERVAVLTFAFLFLRTFPDR